MWTALRIVLCILFVSNLCASQCNKKKEYDATNKGEITSPSYKKGDYAANLNCAYKIKAPSGYRIKLTFLDLDIAPSTSCTSDRLIIHGKDSENVIGIFCGNQIPRPVLSHEDENEILVVFQTGPKKSGRGFRIQYEAAPHFDMCAQNEGVCRNRNCYDVKKICDGVDNCGDGSDEENCDLPVPSPEKCGTTPIKPDTIHGAPDRMVGGQSAAPNSWPWQASVQLRHIEPSGHFCGGVLVNAQWVLTAARCFLNAPFPRSIRVTLGSHKMFERSKYQQDRVAEKIISYPDLEGEGLKDASLDDDIALIKLNAPVLFTDGVQPVCLPYSHWDARPGWTCYTTGWGGGKGAVFSDELKQTEQIVKHVDNCSHDEEKQICVEMHTSAPCQDDAGGPLVCRLAGQWYLMGTTSTGADESPEHKGCSTLESMVLFAKVAHKADWIRETIGDNS